MTMIPNHYSLNIAYDGQHWARVEFSPGLMESDARLRSRQIRAALMETHGNALTVGGRALKWSFRLTSVQCSGGEVEI